jgi:hypothetical protein
VAAKRVGMGDALRGVGIGAGGAAEGHPPVLPAAGVDVVARCARRPRAALATPAALRGERRSPVASRGAR